MTALAPALELLLATLDGLGAPYLIGGSIASGSYGLPRQTNDIDIVADFRNIDMGTFCGLLLKSAFKFDFFPASADGFSQSELSRRRYIISAMPGLGNMLLPVCSAEDAVLSKLVWFRKGGEVSDRQWHDIPGILGVQAARLDFAYTADWATRLSVADLLYTAIDASSRNS